MKNIGIMLDQQVIQVLMLDHIQNTHLQTAANLQHTQMLCTTARFPFTLQFHNVWVILLWVGILLNLAELKLQMQMVRLLQVRLALLVRSSNGKMQTI